MRILCITPWFPAWPGEQSGNFILESAMALLAQGHQLKVLVTQPWQPPLAARLHADWRQPRLQVDRHDPRLGLERVQYLSIPRNYLRALAWQGFHAVVQPAVQRAVDAFRPDVLLAHTELPGAAAARMGQRCGLPSVVVLHGINTSVRLNTGAERARLRATLDAATRVVLVGEPLRAHFAPLAGRTDHFRIVHNGFVPPQPWQRRQDGDWPPTLRFISVSNLHEGKGIDLTLQALALLHRQGLRDWHYTIVGEGRERQRLEALVAQGGIAGHVRFAGAVPHADVYAWLRQADVFVLPSWREAFGIAWLEAMACGLLAIAVRGQGPSAFIRDGDTGLLVAPQDADDVARCLRRVLLQRDSLQPLVRLGQQEATRNFTWEAHAAKLAAVCAEAKAGRS